MKKILAIVGSFRKNSFNAQLAQLAAESMHGKAELEILDYADVPFYNEDIEFPAPAAVQRVREKVKQADAVWFFLPEYNHSYPGVLKNLLDWLSRPISQEEPQVLAGKPATISGVAYGMAGTAVAQELLVSLLFFLKMKLMNTPRLTVGNVPEQLDESGNLKLTVSAPFLKEQADAFLSFLG